MSKMKFWKIGDIEDSILDFAIYNILTEAKRYTPNGECPDDKQATFYAKMSFELMLDVYRRILETTKIKDLPKKIEYYNVALEKYYKRFNKYFKSDWYEVSLFTDRETDLELMSESSINPFELFELEYSYMSELNSSKVKKYLQSKLSESTNLALNPDILDMLIKIKLCDLSIDEKMPASLGISYTNNKLMANYFIEDGDIYPNIFIPAVMVARIMKVFPEYKYFQYHLEADLSKEAELITFPYYDANCILELFKNFRLNHTGDKSSKCYFTGYRLGSNNPIIDELIEMTKCGINVHLYIELFASGEMCRNAEYLINILQEADLNHLVLRCFTNDYKVHAKTVMFTSDSESFALYSTGNFNFSTMDKYVDHMYYTKDITDAEKVFNKIFAEKPESNSVMLELITLIDREIKKGSAGRIYMKVNHLNNSIIASMLVEAVKHGVEVLLMIRTTKGFDSRVLKSCSKYGVYLEHSRVFIFGRNADTIAYISSSDLLYRNLYNRIESYTSITNPEHVNTLVDQFEADYEHAEKIKHK